MSDYDRNRFFGKKKYLPRDPNNFGSRFFNSKNGAFKEPEKPESKPKSIKQPTILLKTREHNVEDVSASPKVSVKEFEATTPTPSTEVHSKTKVMTRSVKFMEDDVLCPENLQDYLQENQDFLVVGIVGAQGVGKSTIMNLLTQRKISEKIQQAIFSYSKAAQDEDKDSIKILSETLNNIKFNGEQEDQDPKEIIFKPQTSNDIENNVHATDGIDFFITKNRIMFLDCQPFSCISTLEDLIKSENKMMNMISDYMSPETNGEINALQLTAFMMSVCHIVIVVQDYFFDSNIIRFIQSAEMLKPTISNPEDELNDHYPHLILVQNKAHMEDFSPRRFRKMQDIYRDMFNKTKMHIASGLGLGSGRIETSLSPDNCGSPINLFLIPEYQETDGSYKGHLPLEDLIKVLRENILGATKFQLTHVNLTEKNWVIYCSKVWDHVKKSNFFVEYAKLMP